MMPFFQFRKNHQGATAIEYALIAAFIAMAIVAALTLLGEDVSDAFAPVSNTL